MPPHYLFLAHTHWLIWVVFIFLFASLAWEISFIYINLFVFLSFFFFFFSFSCFYFNLNSVLSKRKLSCIVVLVFLLCVAKFRIFFLFGEKDETFAWNNSSHISSDPLKVVWRIFLSLILLCIWGRGLGREAWRLFSRKSTIPSGTGPKFKGSHHSQFQGLIPEGNAWSTIRNHPYQCACTNSVPSR